MPRTPKDIADHLVQMYGTSTKGLLMPREEFEQHAERPNVDHRLIRSIDLELRPMGTSCPICCRKDNVWC
jgi:hypothetical protein